VREIVRSTAFKKDVKRAQKRGKDMARLKAVIVVLLSDETLPERLRDHPLRGDWIGYRDLHIEPDWLLLYRKTDEALMLARMGTHSDLFGE
jgi:mRNA interferase YafQ